jgi:hypothetical protein
MRKPVFDSENTDYCAMIICPYSQGMSSRFCCAYGVALKLNSERFSANMKNYIERCQECISEFGTGDLIEGNEFAPGVCSAENWTKE